MCEIKQHHIPYNSRNMPLLSSLGRAQTSASSNFCVNLKIDNMTFTNEGHELIATILEIVQEIYNLHT